MKNKKNISVMDKSERKMVGGREPVKQTSPGY